MFLAGLALALAYGRLSWLIVGLSLAMVLHLLVRISLP
ncbi:hypothetical protein Bsph_3169 [Lysinibacillus sphaericus C3-41]|uniref:Uncharacterized protein n=1 Tax=Lysinibacillus sphaericus (strain C3-41) TaxID=444177 RepID=B1HQ37_LYSSC|nr:hypothetical protein Bsph_3169 [Lysinibacillus sphaericus C3-41]